MGRYPTTGDSSITLSRKKHFSVSLSGQNLDLGDTEGNSLEKSVVNKSSYLNAQKICIPIKYHMIILLKSFISC